MSTTLTTTIQHVNHTTSRATIRQHSFLIDRAVTKGGFDLGPAGGEYMLMALGGCFTSHLLAAIRARETAMTNVNVAVSGTMDGAPERFIAFTLDVTADCQDAELGRKLVTIAERSCQVVNTIRPTAVVAISFNGVAIGSEPLTSLA